MMYFIIATWDVLNGVAALLQAASLTYLMLKYDFSKQGQGKLPGSALVEVSFFVSATTSHSSVFFHLLLVFLRTINIIKPFYYIKRRAVIWAVVVNPLCWMGFATFSIYLYEYGVKRAAIGDFVVRFFYYTLIPNLGHSVFETYADDMEHHHLITAFILVGIPFVLPTIICIVCVIVSNMALRSNAGKQSKVSQKITRTILMITVMFVVCNTTYFMVMTAMHLSTWAKSFYSTHICFVYLVYVAGTMLTFVNSLLNPILLVIRGSSLRQYVESLFKRKRKSPKQQSIDAITLGVVVRNNRVNPKTRPHSEIKDLIEGFCSLDTSPERS